MSSLRAPEHPFPSLSSLSAPAQALLAAHSWPGEPTGTVFLDRAHLIEAAGDWEFAAELLTDMLAELATALPAIEDVAFLGGNCDSTLDTSMPTSVRALSQADAAALGKTAHGLKGAALNLGLQQCARAAQGVELIGKTLAERAAAAGGQWESIDQGTPRQTKTLNELFMPKISI